jgi:nucleoside-diphosphate-sugar epimerase
MSLPDDIDAVVHTVAHFEENPRAEVEAAMSVNVLGTLRLCQAAAATRTRQFVLVSSCSAILSEGSDYFGAYALSKRHGEDVARLACRMHALPLAVLRPTQIYGRGRVPSRTIPFCTWRSTGREEARTSEIYGTRDPSRNYLYDEDLCEVIARVIDAASWAPIPVITPPT